MNIQEREEAIEEVGQNEGAGLVTFLVGAFCGLAGGVMLAILLGARFTT